MYSHELFKVEHATDENVQAIRGLVETGDINLNKIKARYKSENKKETTLSDDEIIFLMAGLDDDYGDAKIVEIMNTRVSGDDAEEVDGDEPETEEEKETKEEQEKIQIDRQTAHTLEKSAKEFAKKLDKGFISTMFDIQKADEKSKRGIAIMLFDRMYGKNKWDNDTWNSIPDPRITPKEAKDLQTKGTNKLLPRWSYKDGNRSRIGDWFETAVINTDEGASLSKVIEDIKEAGTDKVKTKDQQQYVPLGDKGRDRLLRQMEGRLNNIVNRLKRMVRLYLIVNEINELSNTVHAELIYDEDKDGNPSRLTDTIDCLAVWRLNAKRERTGVMESFMPNTFLRLDPSKVDDKLVEQKGNFYEALLATKDRKVDPGKNKNFKLPTTGEEFMAAMNTLQTFFGDSSSHGSFVKYYAGIKDVKERQEVAKTIEEDHFKLSNFYRVVLPDLEKWEKDAADKAASDAQETQKVAAQVKKGKAA